jgi:hypothetical protein
MVGDDDMSAAEVLNRARAVGMQVTLGGDNRLAIKAPAQPRGEILKALMEHKQAIIELLKARPDLIGATAKGVCAQCGAAEPGPLHQHADRLLGKILLHPECVRFWHRDRGGIYYPEAGHA